MDSALSAASPPPSVLPPAGLPKTGNLRDPAQIRKVAQEFESVFMAEMVRHMFDQVEPDPLGDPESEDIYQSWIADEYGKIIAKRGGIGIASHVERQLLELQEIKP